MRDFAELLNGLVEYLHKAILAVKPTWVALVSVVNYVLFPDDAYVPASIALVSALILDIITKYYSISVQNGGLKNAIKTRKVSSSSLWVGTQRKIISYLVIMVLCGLSVRVTMLTSVAVFLSTVAYSIMFLRESQSCIENLIDAGHEDLEWLLFWLKRKQDKVLESENIKSPIEKGIDVTAGLNSSKGGNYDDRV